MFQFHQLLPEFTALENVMIPAFIAGKGKAEASQRAKELLRFMGLADRASHKPAEFFDLREQFGQTFVIVTHDESLAALTDRTIHLRDGMIEAETAKSPKTAEEGETAASDTTHQENKED